MMYKQSADHQVRESRCQKTYEFYGIALPQDVNTLNLFQAVEALGIVKHLWDLDRSPRKGIDARDSLCGIAFLSFRILVRSVGPFPFPVDPHAGCSEGCMMLEETARWGRMLNEKFTANQPPVLTLTLRCLKGHR